MRSSRSTSSDILSHRLLPRGCSWWSSEGFQVNDTAAVMRTAKRRELIPDVLYVERMLHESSHLESSCPAQFTSGEGTGRRLMLPYSLQWNRSKEVVVSRRVISNPSLPAPMRGGAFSSGVEAPAGRTIYVSGQVSMDAAGNVVGEGDVKLQTQTVLEHVKTVVEEAGGGMDDIVKVTVFIRDMRLYDEIHEVRRRYFEEPYPASSMVEVSALIDPRLLIEIEAVAVIE
jgi:2-iminobutanoate/2-iminopropanoate deaminase